MLPDVPEKDAWRADLDPKIQAVRRLAREFADYYIPTDGLFAAACVQQEPTYWSPDGVHPNENGSRFIAGYYAKAVAALIGGLTWKNPGRMSMWTAAGVFCGYPTMSIASPKL